METGSAIPSYRCQNPCDIPNRPKCNRVKAFIFFILISYSLGGIMKISLAPATLLFCIALAPLPAAAGQQEDQSACMNDAMTICSQFIPDRERVASCLISNSTRVSEACRVALTHFDQSRSPPAAASGPVAAPVNSITVNPPRASRTKLVTIKRPSAAVTANRSVGAPINLAAINSPMASRAKLATIKQPAAARTKLTKANQAASRTKTTTIR